MGKHNTLADIHSRTSWNIYNQITAFDQQQVEYMTVGMVYTVHCAKLPFSPDKFAINVE